MSSGDFMQVEVVGSDERFKWWQAVADRRASVCANPNSEDSRAQSVFRRCKDCIIHFFMQYSAEYHSFYVDKLAEKWGVSTHAVHLIQSSKHPKSEFDNLLHNDAQFRMGPSNSIPEGGKATIDGWGPQVRPLLGNRGNEGIMQFNVVTQRVVRILTTLQQGEISNCLRDEAYDQLKDYCSSQKGRGGGRALRVLKDHSRFVVFPYPEDPYNISGKEYFARAWLFANLCANPEEAKQALVLGLSNAVNDHGNVVCVYGTLNHITITLFMTRLYGIAREDTFYQSVKERVADYFADTRKVGYNSENEGAIRRNVLERCLDSKDPGEKAYNKLASNIELYWQASIPNKRQSWQSLEDYRGTISLQEFQIAVRQWINEYYKSFE